MSDVRVNVRVGGDGLLPSDVTGSGSSWVGPWLRPRCGHELVAAVANFAAVPGGEITRQNRPFVHLPRLRPDRPESRPWIGGLKGTFFVKADIHGQAGQAIKTLAKSGHLLG